MSEETELPETTEAPSAPEEEKPKAKGTMSRPGGFQQDSDRPARPGFRNPPTPRSLARQKTKKK